MEGARARPGCARVATRVARHRPSDGAWVALRVSWRRPARDHCGMPRQALVCVCLHGCGIAPLHKALARPGPGQRLGAGSGGSTAPTPRTNEPCGCGCGVACHGVRGEPWRNLALRGTRTIMLRSTELRSINPRPSAGTAAGRGCSATTSTTAGPAEPGACSSSRVSAAGYQLRQHHAMAGGRKDAGLTAGLF